MPYDPLSALPTFFDLLAFFGVVGALSWRLWVLPTRDEPARPDRYRRGWRIRLSLFAAIAGLTITTPLLLLMRAAEMARQTVFEAVVEVNLEMAKMHRQLAAAAPK